MLYLKIMQGNTVVTAEAHEHPVYVCKQAKNNILVRCPEVHAQGVLSLDGSTVYQLDGKASLGLDNDYTAYPTVMTEYEEIISNHEPAPDPEDDNPEIPADDPEAEVLTRAQLTARIHALEDELAAAKILLGVSDE